VTRASEPEMSVILATPGSIEMVGTTLLHLRAQTVRHRLEVVLVVQSADGLGQPPAMLDGFWGHQIVEAGPFRSIAHANARGIGRARAAIVALAEDHCYPQREWAETLIAAHRGPWAVVGPVLRNANPSTAVSWCDFLIAYGPWIDPAPRGPAPFLPGHNSSYKRSVLSDYGDRLEDMLVAETVLHLDLVRQGHALLLEPAARTAHLNFASLPVWLRVQFLAGRTFASTRARGWGTAKRLAYAAAAPLIPFVRLVRLLPVLRRAGWPPRLAWRLAPTLLLGLAVDAAGQAVGCVAGPGEASRQLSRFEFDRIAFVTEEDRRALTLLGSE
jgi:hypothetical protein